MTVCVVCRTTKVTVRQRDWQTFGLKFLENTNGLRHDFRADAVAGEDENVHFYVLIAVKSTSGRPTLAKAA